MSKSVKINNLVFTYNNRKILDHITLHIKKGSMVTIIGPNGSGKSTLLKNISSILSPDEGSVFLGERDLKNYKLKELACEMASVPQNTNIEYDFTVYEIVLMGRNPYVKMFKEETDEDLNIVENAMRKTNTWGLKDQKVNELSGGEIQRVIIARALAQEPKILLLDEPTSALDIHHQIEILDLLRNLNKENGVTIIMVLHDVNLASRYSDELILIHEGKKVIMGSPDAVITRENLQISYKMNMIVERNKYTNALEIIPLSAI